MPILPNDLIIILHLGGVLMKLFSDNFQLGVVLVHNTSLA